MEVVIPSLVLAGLMPAAGLVDALRLRRRRVEAEMVQVVDWLREVNAGYRHRLSSQAAKARRAARPAAVARRLRA